VPRRTPRVTPRTLVVTDEDVHLIARALAHATGRSTGADDDVLGTLHQRWQRVARGQDGRVVVDDSTIDADRLHEVDVTGVERQLIALACRSLVVLLMETADDTPQGVEDRMVASALYVVAHRIDASQ
jgi:hypothetical protein